MPGNKLHFSLRAAATAPLLGETISLPQLHTLFKIFFFLFKQYACVCLVESEGGVG